MYTHFFLAFGCIYSRAYARRDASLEKRMYKPTRMNKKVWRHVRIKTVHFIMFLSFYRVFFTSMCSHGAV